MTYTLTMASDQGVNDAADGVVEVSMTDARANLTRLLREVRYGRRPGAFTERGDRSAYVVPPEFYEQALRDRAIVERLHRMAALPADVSAEESPDVVQRVRIVYEALEAAERDAAAALHIATS